MLAFALEQAQERIWAEDGFTEEDQKAVDRLRILTEVAPRFVPVETSPEDEEFNERLARSVEESKCRCVNARPDEYSLEIDLGSIQVAHTVCGKQPWFMFDDWNESVCMMPVPVRVDQVTGCHSGCGGNPNKMGCDCGPEVTLIPKGKTAHGNDH